MKAIFSWARRHYRGMGSTFLITLIMATLIVGMAGCANRAAVDAIEIRDWYDLAAISNNMSTDYILMNDIGATTDGWEELASPTANDGKGWEPIGGFFAWFTGVFDGQGHEIRDLFVNRPDEQFVGLFGMIGMVGVIRNIGIVDTDVTGDELVGSLAGMLLLGHISNSYFTGSVTGIKSIGGLIGGTDSHSSVSNSYSTGSVSGYDNVGGLVGWNYESTVSNSHSTGSVTGGDFVGGLIGRNDASVIDSYSTSSVTGGNYVGGLVGTSHNITSNCYATGDVTGYENVGGLMGWNDEGAVSNSYSTGSVTGNYSAGGLIAANGGNVTNSFWDTETSGQATSDGGTGKNTTEMKDIFTFSDTETEGLDEPWDITGVASPGTRNPAYIWNIVDDETYPFLSWQPVA